MVTPSTDTSPLQQQQQPFTKGTTVEVSSDDEGFRGAWYSATILEIPPKSASKKRKKALIRYKTLLADDGSSPLTEHVDPAYIRPLPPNEKGGAHQFEVNDVVGASYRDGWWTGVVRKVLEKSRYTVYFDNPPDVIEFDRKDLRVHWNWVDCKWVRPEKLQSTGSIFSSGTAVEVSIGNENLDYIWYPALVVKENEDNTFLVKYQNSTTDDESETVKVVVDSLHIRPIPPQCADRNYKLLERVDAKYNFGWRSGVITKVLSGKRYNVFFKNGNERKEFCHSDIRPNVEWIDGKWVSKSKQTASNDCLFCQHHRSNWTTKRHKAGSADGTTNNLVKRNVRAIKSPSKGSQVPAAGKDGTTQIAEEANEGDIKTKEVEMAIVLGLTAFKKSLQAEKSLQIPSEEPLKLMGDQKNNLNDSVRNENMVCKKIILETKEHRVGASDLKRKRGRPGSSVVTSPKASDAATEDSRGRTSHDYKTKEVHMAAPGISDMADEDQPLSTWIGGMLTSGDEESRLPSSRLVNGWNEEKGLVDVPIESLAIDASGRSPMVNDQSLPFVKRSPVWCTIESMDVFRIVPQKPHFLPLAENREEFREGSAIGIMVTFASLFDKISMLHFDEPRDTFGNILESLSDLEKHGFDVTRLRHRLNKLLSLKEEHNQHLGEIQNAEREIIENAKEISKFDEEMEEIEKKINQLQERHASIKSEKETKNLKVGSLKLHVGVLNKLIRNASHDFKKIATASWKLP